MATLTTLPREVLRWLLSLDLSFPVRNIKRDFSNGFLFAEILSRYYPADIQMHSFENVTSIERKKANWVVLERLFKKRDIPVDQQQVAAIMTAEGDAASDVLQCIFSFISSDAYRQSLECPSSSSQAANSPAGSRHPSVGRCKSNMRERQQEDHMQQHHHHHHQAAIGGYCYGPDGALYPVAYAAQDQQQQQQLMQQMVWQQQVMAYQQQHASQQGHKGGGGDAALLQQQMQQMYAQVMGGLAPTGPEQSEGSSSPLDDLAFSKKPRPVDYQPYKMSDYEAANFDVKKAKGYWQLGRLGPEESHELQAKREARERVRTLSQRINSANQRRLAGASPALSKPKDPSSRQRAVEYAKTSVPRPELLRQRSSLSKQQPQPGSDGSSGASLGSKGDGAGAGLDELQQQHERYAQQVEQIRTELELQLGGGG